MMLLKLVTLGPHKQWCWLSDHGALSRAPDSRVRHSYPKPGSPSAVNIIGLATEILGAVPSERCVSVHLSLNEFKSTFMFLCVRKYHLIE